MESMAEQPKPENVFRNDYSAAQINLIIIKDLLNEKCRIFHCLFISLNLKIPVVRDFFFFMFYSQLYRYKHFLLITSFLCCLTGAPSSTELCQNYSNIIKYMANLKIKKKIKLFSEARSHDRAVAVSLI